MAGLTRWQLGAIKGEVDLGKTLVMERRPGLRFGWRTDQLEPVRKQALPSPVGLRWLARRPLRAWAVANWGALPVARGRRQRVGGQGGTAPGGRTRLVEKPV